MNGSSNSDPIGLVAAAEGLLGALEGSAQVGIGLLLLFLGALVIIAATPAGKAAGRGAARGGRTALKVIPQTRVVGALI